MSVSWVIAEILQVILNLGLCSVNTSVHGRDESFARNTVI